MNALQEERVAVVHRRVTASGRSLAQRHPAFATVIGQSFDWLRAGLEHAHAGCGRADAHTWAEYVADLDRGLDQLEIEAGRAADRQDAAAGVTDVLVIHTSRLELQGWRLAVSLHDTATADTAGVRGRLAAAETQLDRYRSAETGAEPSAHPLQQAIARLRQAGR